MTDTAPNKWYDFVPNMLTLFNLICGIIAIYFAFIDELQIALLLMLTGGLFDFFDGFAARMLKVSGELGKQLDSLADLITFGLLPAVMIFSIQRQLILANNHGFEQLSILQWLFLVSPLLIPVFSALRLANFNIDTRQTTSFIGVPTPANAFFMASLAWTISYGNNTIAGWLANPLLIAAITLLFSLLLVSNLPLFALKFKSFKWNGNEIRFVFLAISLVVLLFFTISGLMAVILLYILFSAFTHYVQRK
ncbi:MAG: CDP-diacylglycerol--serine O-phosphatidyltransferase [Prolixibacteraceae bacterium]